MPAAVLKGNQNGYEILLKDEYAFETILTDLVALLDQVQNETLAKGDKLSFALNTQNRLLTEEQMTTLADIFKQYRRFSIKTFSSNVVSKKQFGTFIEERTVHLCGDIIPNGQVREIVGDVLFCGAIHKGGILKATGSIFLLGTAEGIVYAGASGDALTVICGDVAAAQQVRIADLVSVVSEADYGIGPKLIYVNDLHALEVGAIAALKKIRPKVFTQIGGFI